MTKNVPPLTMVKGAKSLVLMLENGKWKFFYVARGILGIEQSTHSLGVESR